MSNTVMKLNLEKTEEINSDPNWKQSKFFYSKGSSKIHSQKNAHTPNNCVREMQRERGAMQLGVGMGEKEKSKKKKRKEREREEMNNYWVSDSWG